MAAMAAMVLIACGEPPVEQTGGPRASEPSPLSSYPPDQLFEGTGIVKEEKGEEVVLCLGGAGDTAPPHCDGPKVRGWSWDGIEHDELAGHRWGTYTVTGTYVDGVFTPHGEPKIPEPYVDQDGDAITAPCPEPDGGWEIPDPDRTGEENIRAAIREAEAQPDSAGVWIDYIVEPTDEMEMAPYGENIILVLAFTGDAERHEAEAREHWGGALCIWLHERTNAELGRIQEDVSDSGWPEEMGIETTWSDRDITVGTVSIGVIVSTPAFEAEVAERYGEGVVRVFPALRPVED